MKSMNFEMILGVLALIFCIGIVIYLIVYYIKIGFFYISAEKTKGKIINSSIENFNRCIITVKYSVQGKEYIRKVTLEKNIIIVNPGIELDIYYNRKNVQDIRIKEL